MDVAMMVLYALDVDAADLWNQRSVKWWMRAICLGVLAISGNRLTGEENPRWGLMRSWLVVWILWARRTVAGVP